MDLDRPTARLKLAITFRLIQDLGVWMRAGLPMTVAPAGTSRVTTEAAPTMASSPMVMPGRKDSAADSDVVAVVDEEGRTDDGAFADGGEDLFELDEVRGGVVRGGVVFVDEGGYVEAVGGEDGVVGVVEVA